MITEVTIENYKSIKKLKLELGRVTVLIGENLVGKTNILEAIAFASAASDDALDNTSLVSRGIRVSENPVFMRCGTEKSDHIKPIKISVKDNQDLFRFCLKNAIDRTGYVNFLGNQGLWMLNGETYEESQSQWFNDTNYENIAESFWSNTGTHFMGGDFVIYDPEDSKLRVYEKEEQLQSLGIGGEGLFKLLSILKAYGNKSQLYDIQQRLALIGSLHKELTNNIVPLELLNFLLTKVAEEKITEYNFVINKSFLFLLFYLVLFISDATPKFFAIDNIATFFNPRLCRRVVQELVSLAKKYDKQIIFTAHNPAVLDGLDLTDDAQRLFTVSLNLESHTKVNRILAPKPLEGQEPVKLSEAFLRGYLGGLSSRF
jgi:AAA15 family ATPase/GTPase